RELIRRLQWCEVTGGQADETRLGYRLSERGGAFRWNQPVLLARHQQRRAAHTRQHAFQVEADLEVELARHPVSLEPGGQAADGLVDGGRLEASQKRWAVIVRHH